MVQNIKNSCPQCLHHNPDDALKCSLCDFPLKDLDLDLDKTRLPDTENHTDANDLTIQSNATLTSIDPDLTQAPDDIKLFTADNTKHTVNEKQTFHLAGDLAHFEIHEVLGEGGMGAVYHAKDLTLHRDVAIKMLRPMQASGFQKTEVLLDEARMASKLNHPNIVTIYDVARSKDSNYIVMEWVDGKSLDEIIPEDGLSLIKSLEYACQIANGLTLAHKKYIIHRDIKPHNIMLSSDNTIKILDFGIAGMVSQFDNENTDSKDTSTGTPSYMSPEQAQGLNLDQRSDIFSFGIVLYQMLCGKRPFVAETFTELKNNICSGNYVPIQEQIPDLPQKVSQLVEKMLATAKDERWQSSAELAESLQDIYSELTYKKNWWQRRNWISKAAIILPFIMAIGWSSKEILFPASTQQLIERQLQEANKIAILPFENISGDPQIQLFSDGLAVNLGSDLASIASQQGNTWIVPSTEISRINELTPKKVFNKYGANLILTGSIQHMGSTRLLVLNLLEAKTGQLLKTAEVSINSENLFQGHGFIREQALTLLEWNVPKNLIQEFEYERPQLDGAYREYIEGEGFLYRYDQKDNLENAHQSFRRAISIDKTYELAYVGLAESQYRLFKHTDDAEWLDKMKSSIDLLKRINSRQPKINYLSGKISYEKGQYEISKELFTNSIKLNPNHIESYLGLANSYEKLKDFNKTEEIYNKARVIAPNNTLVLTNLGVYYFYIGEYKKAIHIFKEQIKQAPNNHWAYLNLAAGYYLLGQIDEAIVNTEIAISINPTADSYANLGTMNFYKGNYDKSVKAYEKMIAINSNDYINWGNLGDAYFYSDQQEKSIKAFKKAAELAEKSLDLNSNDSMAIAHIAYYLVRINNTSQSLSYARRINQENTGLENFVVAIAFTLLNQNDLAFEHLNFAINKNYPLDEIQQSPLLNSIKTDSRFDLLGQ
ncbi:MAG: protein kinase [Marinicellaceae bacterium]